MYLDGGVTTGNDVYKALALGARMVCMLHYVLKFYDKSKNIREMFSFVHAHFIGLCWSTATLGPCCWWRARSEKNLADLQG